MRHWVAWHGEWRVTHVSESVDRSLQKLGVECLDVLLVHRPSPLMDFDELAATFERLRQVGKVLHFGVSNFTPTQFAALHRRFPLVTNQVEFSPLHLQPMEDGVFEGLQDQHVSPMIWSALGGGQLFSGSTTQVARVHRALTTVGHAMGLAPAAVVYAWIMCLPCRPVPLTGSGRIAAVRDAVAATQVRMELLPWFEILEAARGVEVA